MLNQAFQSDMVPPGMMDQLWAAGWRHFGTRFFRYSHTFESGDVKTIQPLRLRLSEFSPGKTHRRLLRQLEPIQWEVTPAAIRDDNTRLFHRHKQRFIDNVPDHLTDFLSPHPATVPCPCLEFRLHDGDSLIAASFLDTGTTSTSGIYGVFDPAHPIRSPGILTMLLEIRWSIDAGHEFYYPGYATLEPGLYDYKKQFRGLEYLDWETGAWMPLRRNATSHGA